MTWTEIEDRLRKEHHSAWTWAHQVLQSLLHREKPKPEWRQTSLLEWEAEVGDRTLSIHGSLDSRYVWHNFGPLHESGVTGSLEDAMFAAEKSLK